MNPVLVLHAALLDGPAPPAFQSLLESLPYARRLELERRDERDRCASLAGLHLVLSAARRLLGRPVAAAEFRFLEGLKPELAAGPFFSVSHGRTRVGAALCISADVGFDLEDTRGGEGGALAGVAGLAQWTATEAVLKAAGRGLRDARAVHLADDRESATFGGRVYRLWPLDLHEGTVAHVAAAEPIGPVEIEEVVLPLD